MNYTSLGVLMIAGSALYAVAGVSISRRILHGRVQEGPGRDGLDRHATGAEPIPVEPARQPAGNRDPILSGA